MSGPGAAFTEVLTGRCPSCGANVEFKIGSSRATVCAYCKSVVARKGQDLSVVGKVADVIPTGSKIALGTHGQYEGARFEVLGRLQYKWQGGVWDEWFLGFSDGRRGWLAEAQGRFYVTFPAPPRPLPARVSAGRIIAIDGLGRFTVSDVKRAQIVGASGELPDPVALGETPLTADIESEKGGFGTIDYGTNVSDESGAAPLPVLYVGTQVPFESLALSELAPLAEQRQERPTGDALKCPKCGAPITLRVPDQSQRVVCESCGSLLDCTGALRVLETIALGAKKPRIPLGTAGTLRGKSVVVAGWMVRGCHVEHHHYTWEEFLLWEEKTQSFSWLVDSDGHWQVATPISAGAVHAADDADYKNEHYRHYSSVQGTVELVLGELYWQVHKGESSQLDDYIAPPHGLSRERSKGEVNWTYLEHLEANELAAAFKLPALTREAQTGVGEIQPWPRERAYKSVKRWFIGGLLAMLALFVLLCARTDTVLIDEYFDPASHLGKGLESSALPTGETVASYISPPFDLGGDQALSILMKAQLDNDWAYVSGAVINDESGLSTPFSLEASYYSGVDDGEGWHEGDDAPEVIVSAPDEGKAIVRADFQWDPNKPQPVLHLKVSTVSFSGGQFLCALLALCAMPIWMMFSRSAFEATRWEDSNLGEKPDATHSRNDDGDDD